MKQQDYVEIDGALLRVLRMERRLRQADLAALVGIDTSYVCMLETGRRRRASRAVADGIAAAMGVNLASFLGGERQIVQKSTAGDNTGRAYPEGHRHGW